MKRIFYINLNIMPAFIAFKLPLDNMLFPGRLEIDALNVTYYKGNIWGYQSTVIARSSIASVSIGGRVFFADVIIEIIGGEIIEAKGFKKADARTIIGF